MYDIQNDLFCILPHAMERFSIPCYDLKYFSKHLNEFVYDGDVALFNYEMHQLMQHKTFFHNLQYRWLDKQGKPI